MAEEVQLFIDGRPFRARSDTSVAAAVFQCGISAFHHSVTGKPRAALCGMGTCYECRLTIDGRPNCRSCQIAVTDGMKVETR